MKLKNKREPERFCTGCRERKPKSSLLRIAFKGGKASLDPEGISEGRGAYICKSENCFNKAVEARAFNRSFKSKIEKDDMEKLKKDFTKYIIEERNKMEE